MAPQFTQHKIAESHIPSTIWASSPAIFPSVARPRLYWSPCCSSHSPSTPSMPLSLLFSPSGMLFQPAIPSAPCSVPHFLPVSAPVSPPQFNGPLSLFEIRVLLPPYPIPLLYTLQHSSSDKLVFHLFTISSYQNVSPMQSSCTRSSHASGLCLSWSLSYIPNHYK